MPTSRHQLANSHYLIQLQCLECLIGNFFFLLLFWSLAPSHGWPCRSFFPFGHNLAYHYQLMVEEHEFIVKAYESSSPLLLLEPSSSLTLTSTVCTPSVMQRTCLSPPVATFFIVTPEHIRRHKEVMFSQ